MFSKACEHGLRAIIYIAAQSLEGRRVKIGDIAKYTDSPEAFTGKVIGALAKCHIVNSHTGPNGGFDISERQMMETRAGDVIKAIDGEDAYMGCVLGLKECSEANPCPMHEQFSKVRFALKKVLETTTVYDLAINFKFGKGFLKK